MHSILGGWQILNVKERKDETFAFEIENSCFFESVLPTCAIIEVEYLCWADLSSPDVTAQTSLVRDLGVSPFAIK